MGCDLTYVGAHGEIRRDAFHGTTLQNALKILQSGFRPAIGIAGMGCYFDLGNDTSARERALFHADDNLSQATIIQAELHLGKLLTLISGLTLPSRRNLSPGRSVKKFS